jgi:uncharacterized repeat protein (TIGR03803 family)
MKFSNLVAGVCATAMLVGCGGSHSVSALVPQASTSQRSSMNQAYHVVHPFGRSVKDGKNPAADLINVKGVLYGTTYQGGSHGDGTVFSITTGGNETVLHTFDGSDGYHPVGKLLNVNGTLYGTTSGGGPNGGGTVFSLTLSGDEHTIHGFPVYEGSPLAGVINVGGTLYGTTGGLDGYYYCGEVFSLATTKKFKVLHRFGYGSTGCSPQATLLNVGGILYGTAVRGGKYGGGTVFSISTDGSFKTIYNFGENGSDGTKPQSALINVQGTLFGTTYEGGASGNGTIFSITTSGTENVAYSFNGGDGGGCLAGLTNVKGVIYGTTSSGGANKLGTVFKFTKNGTLTVVHSFAQGEGLSPRAGVIAVDGTLYGTTYGQTVGNHIKRSFGNVFSLAP